MEEQKIFCKECKMCLTDIDPLEECECGSRNFIYGDTLVKVGEEIRCNCGATQMNKVAHYNLNPRYISIHKCCGCDATICTEVYYESPYYSYEDMND